MSNRADACTSRHISHGLAQSRKACLKDRNESARWDDEACSTVLLTMPASICTVSAFRRIRSPRQVRHFPHSSSRLQQPQPGHPPALHRIDLGYGRQECGSLLVHQYNRCFMIRFSLSRLNRRVRTVPVKVRDTCPQTYYHISSQP